MCQYAGHNLARLPMRSAPPPPSPSSSSPPPLRSRTEMPLAFFTPHPLKLRQRMSPHKPRPPLQPLCPQARARPPTSPRKRARISAPQPSPKHSPKHSPKSRHRDSEGPPDLALSSHERLPKVLARLGVASRRGAEALIAAGRVTVNGSRPSQPGHPVDVSRDVLAVDGEVVSTTSATGASPIWLAVHKPRGYLCDLGGARSLTALPATARAIRSKALVPVGRLPELAAGIVLFTNERGCVPHLADPANLHIKEWSVDVRGRPSSRQFDAIANVSAFAESGERLPKSIQVVEVGTHLGSIGANSTGRYTQFIVRLRDGRHHAIQRLVEHAGMDMLRLTRLSFGPVALGSLKAGSFRFLTPKEIKALKRGVLEQNIS